MNTVLWIGVYFGLGLFFYGLAKLVPFMKPYADFFEAFPLNPFITIVAWCLWPLSLLFAILLQALSLKK